MKHTVVARCVPVRWLSVGLVLVSCAAVGCGGPLDVGEDLPDGLPVGADNAVILLNDSAYDNWHGEYAVLLAHGGGPRLLGVVVSTGGLWTDLQANATGWQTLLIAAEGSELAAPLEAIASDSAPLERPEDDDIEQTRANDSAGARFIVEETARVFRETSKPVVLAVGGRLTDVADAYLIDPSVAERVVVVASVGSGFGEDGTTAELGRPNGEMDPWADEVVIRRFTYVQVAAHYDQLTDLPESRLPELPANSFGDWIAAKQSRISDNPVASDQVSVLVGALDEFPVEFASVSPAGFRGDVPTLAADPEGGCYLVTKVDGASATRRFWQLLRATN